ncbi:hypothetical protein SAMN05192564_11110 [Paraburkholderia sartisoli]|uniref:Uncharacterized protein n=1 Tax=Paraburkholderia sartisoli TaxID=83784 RepID=A0A1H4HLZ5_9BURK|nr:hypothetical protein SAMN05192564_11110 [Paraburkholderia sartisoli]
MAGEPGHAPLDGVVVGVRYVGAGKALHSGIANLLFSLECSFRVYPQKSLRKGRWSRCQNISNALCFVSTSDSCMALSFACPA